MALMHRYRPPPTELGHVSHALGAPPAAGFPTKPPKPISIRKTKAEHTLERIHRRPGDRRAGSVKLIKMKTIAKKD